MRGSIQTSFSTYCPIRTAVIMVNADALPLWLKSPYPKDVFWMQPGRKFGYCPIIFIPQFVHPDCSESQSRSREACTTSGAMLSEVKTLSPEDLHLERYPKWKVQQQSRKYPVSCHDNKFASKSDISVFSNGVGRRKFPDDLSQSKSHFHLCHDSAENHTEGPRGSFSTYQTDFTSVEAINVPNWTRRFPHNHKLRSTEAVVRQAEEQFIWSGQDKSNIPESMEVLAAANRSSKT